MTTTIQTVDEHLTVAGAAEYLGVSPWTLRNWDKTGKLKPKRHPVNGYRIYRQADLETILQYDNPLGKRKGTLTPAFDWDDIKETEHFVQFYETDAYLVESVSGFVAKGLSAGEGIVVIATRTHRNRIQKKLAARGLDLAAAGKCGQCVWLDAAETLSGFMVDGSPDPDLFKELIGGTLAKAGQDRPRVRAFGEMVALLWAEGNRAGAKRLEQLWNELAKEHSFALFCAYPISGFGEVPDGAPFTEVCSCHSRVIPAESYASLYSRDDQLRAITILQQKAQALEAEVERRKEAERELSDFVENAPEGLHTVGSDGKVIWANKAELDLLGYEDDEYIGHHIAEFHADHEEIDDILRRLHAGEQLQDREARLRCKDGSIKHVLINSNVLWQDGEFLRTRCFTRDITERKRTEQRLETQNAVTRILAESATLTDAAPRILEAVCECLGWQVGDLWYTEQRKNVLICADVYHVPHMPVPQFETISRQRTFEQGIGLPGRIWASRKAAWIPDVVTDGNFSRAPVAAAEGLRSALGLPIILDGNVLGVMEFFSQEIRQPDEDLLQMMTVIGSQIGQFIERKRAEEALKASQQQFARFMQHLPGLAWLKDLQGRYVYVNEAAEEAFRKPRAELYGKSDDQVFPPDSAAMFMENDQRALASTAGVQVVETLKQQDGVLHHSIVNKFPILGPDGKPALLGGMAIDITDRKRAEEALRESEQRLASEVRALNHLHELSTGLLSSPDLQSALDEVLHASTVISGSEQGLLQLCNRQINALEIVAHCGFAQDFIDLFRIVRGEDTTACSMAMKERKPVVIEDVQTNPIFEPYRAVAVSAGFRAIHSTPLLSHNGDVLGVLSLYFPHAHRPSERAQRILDLYARQAANLIERMRDQVSKATLAAIVESSVDAIISKDLNSIITSWNAGAARLFGYTAEEAIGQPVTMLMPPDRVNEEPEILGRIRRGECIDHYETVRQCKDRTLLDISLTVSPVRDANGRVVGASKVARNITERKAAEKAVRLRSAQYESLLNQAPLGVYLLDADFRIRDVNPIAQAAFGLPEVIGQDFGEVMHILWEDEYAKEIVRIFRHTLETGEPYFMPECIETRRDFGKRDFYEWQINRIILPDGRYGVVCYFRDISTHVLARDALKEVDRRKDEFLATLAHELRNPLAPIRNSLQILRMTGGSAPAAQRVHEMMERQVVHMVRLVDDLLEISRISRGTVELKREPVALATVINNAIETSKPLIEAADHQLAVSLPPEPFIVEGDMVRLSQVFANLLNNAAKYTNRGGNISISARREERQLIVSIRDTGIGIPRDMLSRVFDMFTQVDNSLRRSQDGLGIGLSLVRTIVSMHGGNVEARSDGLGRGSEFLVRLPITAPSDSEPKPAPKGQEPAVAPTTRILVVDDNRDAADSLAMLLKLLGADVHLAYDGPSALEALSICRPSVVLLDIGMPGMDGNEVARRVRKDSRFSNLPLIALTGWGQENDRRHSQDSGFDHHLVKPVDFGALQALLVSLDGQKSPGALLAEAT